MNSAENIRNAFKVVRKTYENVNKMMNSCRTFADEESEYVVSVPRFLRWRSDTDFDGWLINDFILLFQRKDEEELENKWRNGSVYVLDIDFEYENNCAPKVYISKYEYKNIDGWEKGCSPADHSGFYWPIRKGEEFDCIDVEDYKVWTPKKGMEAVTDKKYWGIKRAVCYTEELTDINADNIKEKIFDRFTWLKDK